MPDSGVDDDSSKLSISAIIPAYNEERTVGEIASRTLRYADEVFVIDNGSADDTVKMAREAGVNVLWNEENRGILFCLRRGFGFAMGDIFVTLDADGQHDPEEIPKLVEPILSDNADLVLGRRPELPHFSERIIAWLTRFMVDVRDASTGFRAIRRSVASRMKLHGSCACGTFILEANSLDARVAEVPIAVRERAEGKRRIKTRHIKQILYVTYDIIRFRGKDTQVVGSISDM